MNFFTWIKRLFNKKKKSELKNSRPLTDDQFRELKAKRQKKLDSILDKVTKVGYDKLTNSEKEFLRNYK